MGKKGHLTFEKGHLIFGGECVRTHALPQIRHWYYTVIVEIVQNTDFFQNTCFKENDNMAVEKISY